MTTKLRKAAISTIAVTLGAGVTATATPSAAQGWHGHGWHGPGWHGGGLHGGYWRGGRWYGGGWGGPAINRSRSAIDFGPVAQKPRYTAGL